MGDSDYVTKKELSDALRLFGEQGHALDSALARFATELTALKAILALLLNPDNPKRGLERIEEFRETLAKHDPNAEARKQIDEVLEMLELIDKHGAPHKS